MATKPSRLLSDPELVAEYLSKELSRRQVLQQAAIAGAGALAGQAQPAPTPPTRHLVGMGYHPDDESRAIEAALAELPPA